MQTDLDELKQRIGRELEEIETRSAHLSAQLEHLIVVEVLAQHALAGESAKSEIDPSEFRRAILGEEETS